MQEICLHASHRSGVLNFHAINPPNDRRINLHSARNCYDLRVAECAGVGNKSVSL